ncbi:MAG: 4-vinyl reductase [Anaerolineales bacterium]|nr:4-vinyl reductase [Anaerolineales bacterium]
MEEETQETREFYLPNKMGRIFILSHEEILGKTGMNAVLKIADLPGWIGQLPANNFEPGFSFTTCGKIEAALEKMYGPAAGRGLALRTGHAAFKYGLREFSSLLGITELSFRLLPLSMKIQNGLKALNTLYNQYSDQIVRLEKENDGFLWHIDRCPYCWGRDSDSPCCHHAVGIFQEAMHWISGGKYFHVEESSCKAAGEPSCTIHISSKPVE